MSAYASGPETLHWHISRTCEGGACVAVASHGDSVLVKNTSHPEGPVNEFTRDEWRHFVAGVKLGHFDEVL